MAETKPYTIKEEPWTLSEFKQILITLFSVFKEKQAQFLQAINAINQNVYVAKVEYVAALYAFYSAVMKNYDRHILDEKNKIDFTPDDYFKLLITPAKELDSIKIISMGYYLERWNNYYGHAKMNHEEFEYDDPAEQLRAENEI